MLWNTRCLTKEILPATGEIVTNFLISKERLLGNLLITDEDLLSDFKKAPKCNAVVMLAEILIDFIFQFGAPKEIRVSNVIVEAGLEQIDNVCGTKLCRVKRLKGLEEFKYSMQRF